MILGLFNPENDLALANGLATYVAPRSIRKMSEDLFELPRLWIYADALRCFKAHRTYAQGEIAQCEVWGWSLHARRKLLEAGISPQLLPTEEMIAQMRLWSHRAHTIEVLTYLQEKGYPYALPIMPFRATTVEQVDAFVERYPQAVMKQPWSSSGKGLLWAHKIAPALRQSWVNQTIQKMGDVMCEPRYEKVFDLAMGFYVDATGQVEAKGYSMFLTDDRGIYLGNALLSDQAILDYAGRHIDVQQLHVLQRYLHQFFSERIAHFHRGYLGVDLMISQDTTTGAYFLHPCVEVNLRMTMGLLARFYHDRSFISIANTGIFRILREATPAQLKATISSMQAQNPDLQLLSTVTTDSLYAAVAYPVSDLDELLYKQRID